MMAIKAKKINSASVKAIYFSERADELLKPGRIKVGWCESDASEQKGVMQWTGTMLTNVACFRLPSGLAM